MRRSTALLFMILASALVAMACASPAAPTWTFPVPQSATPGPVAVGSATPAPAKSSDAGVGDVVGKIDLSVLRSF